MKIKIPLVVTPQGRVNSAFFRREDGREVQDVRLLFHDTPTDTSVRLVHVEADLDLEAIFRADTIAGEVVDEPQECLSFREAHHYISEALGVPPNKQD